MRIKDILCSFIKYLYLIPSDMPLHAEEMFSIQKYNKKRLKKKNKARLEKSK
jgi:hypothetical protein